MRRWIPALLIIAAYALSAAVYRDLPVIVAPDLSALLPFMADARPDAGPRTLAAFLLPTVALLLWLAMHEAPVRWLGRAAARVLGAGTSGADDYWKYAPSYRLIVAWVVALVLSVHVALLAATLSWSVPPGSIVGAVFGLGMVVVGNAMPRLRPNAVAGLRTPRTLADPQLWARVHRAYGAAWLASGVVVLVVAIAAPRYAFVTALAALVVTSLGALVAPRTMALASLLAALAFPLAGGGGQPAPGAGAGFDRAVADARPR